MGQTVKTALLNKIGRKALSQFEIKYNRNEELQRAAIAAFFPYEQEENFTYSKVKWLRKEATKGSFWHTIGLDPRPKTGKDQNDRQLQTKLWYVLTGLREKRNRKWEDRIRKQTHTKDQLTMRATKSQIAIMWLTHAGHLKNLQDLSHEDDVADLEPSVRNLVYEMWDWLDDRLDRETGRNLDANTPVQYYRKDPTARRYEYDRKPPLSRQRRQSCL